ncbi:DUF6881 domain-containing protein [Paenibacillus sp. NPDC058174]|uniref:DUF6881 domain-containing protein n=1 Tax=Paenibacillus sp. NPDC058174 TaxID=3346366 RepID=UPI0036DD6586
MRYIYVEYKNYEERIPQTIFSEIDDLGYEVRKIEKYFDGTVSYAPDDRETGITLLADQVIPNVDEINAEEDVQARHLTKDEFEKLWFEYTNE